MLTINDVIRFFIYVLIAFHNFDLYLINSEKIFLKNTKSNKCNYYIIIGTKELNCGKIIIIVSTLKK